MLRLHQIPLPLDQADQADSKALCALAAKRLGLPVEKIKSATLVKRSVDARDRRDVHFTLTLDVLVRDGEAEKRLAGRFQPNQVTLLSTKADEPDVFSLPMQPCPAGHPRPVVVGLGPAGLFCALALAVRGARPIVLERGKPVALRMRDVERLETEGALGTESNVLFGEGGAGAFSDGKLTCGLNSPLIRTVLKTLVRCGAPEDILTAAHPHIGTDVLREVLLRARAQLLRLGAEIRFGHRLDGLMLRDGRVVGARVVSDGAESVIETDAVFLAIGHSARDTLARLHVQKIPMQQKPFAIGVRIEHLQHDVDRAQYGAFCGHPALPHAEYKLHVATPDKRGVYTFCMCPGGRVVNASNEEGLLNVNGMSLHARDGENANAALLVGVSSADFGNDEPLAGLALQRQIERAAYLAGGGAYRAPCQRVGDLLARRASAGFGSVLPTYRPGATPGDVGALLPDFVTNNLRYALPKLGALLRGFDAPDALLTAAETRSSSPVRITRDERRQSTVRGLYPLGEGAGYAGGIVSAALDGLAAARDWGVD